MTDCIFCKIVSGEIPSNFVYEDDDVVAFDDMNPQSPAHTLIIPKRHISTLNDLTADDAELMGKLFLGAKEVAKIKGVDEDGYRTLINCNKDGGQVVFHIHLHLMGGRRMGWPPG